jgi:hypothetical protein
MWAILAIKSNLFYSGSLIGQAMTFSMSLGGDQKIPRKYIPHLYGKVQKLPILGGLYHHYIRSTA